MTLYHINDKGEYHVCKAKSPDTCPFEIHIEGEEEAKAFSDNIYERLYDKNVKPSEMTDFELKVAYANMIENLARYCSFYRENVDKKYTPLSKDFLRVTQDLSDLLKKDEEREREILNTGGTVLKRIKNMGGENEYLFENTQLAKAPMSDRIKVRYEILRRCLDNGYVYRKPVLYQEDLIDLEIYQENIDKLPEDIAVMNERLPYYHLYLDAQDFELRPETRGKQPRRPTPKQIRGMFQRFDFSQIPEDFYAYQASLEYKEIAPKFLEAVNSKESSEDSILLSENAILEIRDEMEKRNLIF